MRTLFAAYAAGSLGGLLTTILGWSLGTAGVFAMAGSSILPPLTDAVIYQRLAWGGIWGIAFPMLGLSRLRHLHGALLLSLLPTAAQLLYFFPNQGLGWFGLTKGLATPAIVFVMNLFWGWVTSFAASRTMG